MRYLKIAINQIDKRLIHWKAVRQQAFPQTGWVNLIRTALGLSSYQLAHLIGVNQARVIQIEAAEQNDAITLRTLEKRAKVLAKKRVERVTHSMRLEAQTISKAKQQEQYKELLKELLEGPPKKLWSDE